MHQRVAVTDLILALGCDDFASLLCRYLESGITAGVLFAYAIPANAASAALLLGTTVERDRLDTHQALWREYAIHDFTEDPLIHSRRACLETTPFVKVRHASEVRNRTFRKRYFDDMGHEAELSIVGGGGSELLYIGFTGACFSQAETQFASKNAQLVLALLRKDRALRAPLSQEEASGPNAEDAAVQSALAMNPAGLTRREVEICACVVKGQTSEHIASLLGISPHTVATHRKRAYAKLGVSSKTELFARIYTVARATGCHAPPQ